MRVPYFVDGATDLVALCRELSRRGLGDALVRNGDRVGAFTTTDLRDALPRPSWWAMVMSKAMPSMQFEAFAPPTGRLCSGLR